MPSTLVGFDGVAMPLVYLSTGRLMGIWVASMLALPIEVLLLIAVISSVGMMRWWRERHIRLMWLAITYINLRVNAERITLPDKLPGPDVMPRMRVTLLLKLGPTGG